MDAHLTCTESVWIQTFSGLVMLLFHLIRLANQFTHCNVPSLSVLQEVGSIISLQKDSSKWILEWSGSKVDIINTKDE